MRHLTNILEGICLVLFCASCSMMPWSKSKTAFDSRYEKNAVTMNITGDPQLNLYQERPHSLVLCLYELKEPNMFSQLSDEREGIFKLMECGRFDGSVAYVKRQIVQPGDKITASVDRAEGAKYLGIAAGYYDIKKSGVIRLLPIDTVGRSTISVDILLGPRAIVDLRVR